MQRLLIAGKGWTGVGQNIRDNGWSTLGFDVIWSSFFSMKMGASGLEPPETEVGGFTDA